jgi:Helicase conserved C-terminal domain
VEAWGGDDLGALSRYDGLRSVRLTALGRYVLGLSEAYQPPASEPENQALKVLPTLDVVVTGVLFAGDQLVLSAYAEHTAERVWSVSAASLLGAINTGRDLGEFTTFLTQRTEHALPDSLATLIGDVTRRTRQLTDLGHARVIECADPALATLLTRDRALRALCYPIGERHLAVPLEGGLKFRTALLKLGYVLPGQPTP